jgi:hypothetical protein
MWSATTNHTKQQKNNNRKSSGTNHTMLHLSESKSKPTNSEHQIQQPHWTEKKTIFQLTHNPILQNIKKEWSHSSIFIHSLKFLQTYQTLG